MIDTRELRKNPEIYAKACKDKGFDIDINSFLDLDKKYLEVKNSVETLYQQRNELTKNIEIAKRSGDDATEQVNQVKDIKEKLESLEKNMSELEVTYNDMLLRIPNLPSSDTPIGKDDSENIEIAKVGNIKTFDFKPLPHREILEERNLLDSQRAVKISGSRFIMMRDGLARLEMALVMRAINKLNSKGFSFTLVPTIVKKEAMFSTGYLPYGEESIYKVINEDGEQMYLVGTAEVPLVAQHSDETIDLEKLPLRYVAYSHCYRGEAGTYGRDTKGMIRVHQFDKVEMVSFVKPEDSEKEHQLILQIEEEVYQDLGIPYRKLAICTGDLGMPATKKYDLEARFPGIDTYKEITSCSNCGDFQARRCKTKYKDGSDKNFVHILNGTVIALSRTLAAIVENYQTADKKIIIPEVLRPYMNGEEII